MKPGFSFLTLIIFGIFLSTASLNAVDEMDFSQLGELSLEELLSIEVNIASNIIGDRVSQPVSITTITGNQIRACGARNIMEVLNFFVPGFFHVPDQDDNIAGFRGIAPDNNSKVMFLLNGHSLNTEWFLGVPDGLMNGLALDYIGHIDVIRGPGSVTLGQGALLGVVNIVTKAGNMDGTLLSISAGQDDYMGGSVEMGRSAGDLKSYFHFSLDDLDGQALRAEGNATRPWEGVEGDYIYDSGLQLGRSRGYVGIGNLSYRDWKFNLLHADQRRDLYNFRRDRSIYQQVLTSISMQYSHKMGDSHHLSFDLGFDNDEYHIHSPGGYSLGGTRENRLSLKALWTYKTSDYGLALGAEAKRFLMGKKNSSNNNFLINRADESLLNHPNVNNQWVYPKDIEVTSFFGEGVYALNDDWNLFAAFRFDRHPFWGSQVSPRLGALYRVGDNHRYRLSYQTGFRGAPGVHYAGGFQGDGLLREENFSLINEATNGNAADLSPIEPEEIESVEIEGTWNMVSHLNLNAVLFHNTVKNVIGFGAFGSWMFTPVPDMIGSDIKGDWDGYWYFQNTPGEIKTEGLELSAAYRRDRVEIGFSHSMVRVASVAEESYGSLYIAAAEVGRHFKGYPENVTRFNISLNPKGRFQGYLNGVHYGDWYQQDTRGKGQTIVNGTIEGNVGERLKLRLALNNMLDSDELYPFTEGSIPAGQVDPRPGTPSVPERSLWATARYNF